MQTKSAAIGLVVGALAVSAVSYADLGTPSGVVIPYSGTLEVNGAPLTGNVDLIFDVFPSDSATSCFTTPNVPTDVVAGTFSVLIGPVPDFCVVNQSVHLSVSIDDGNTVAALPGRQRVYPALGAMTSGAGDFAAGDISAGDISVSSVSAGGSISASGAINGAAVSDQGFGAQYVGIAHPALEGTTGYGGLFSSTGDSFVNSTGTGAVHLRYNNADILVAGNSTIETQRNLVVNGTVSQQCRAGFTPINGGRLCISSAIGPQIAMQTEADNAIDRCRASQARVCSHEEVQMVCSAGFDVYSGAGATAFWYGTLVGDDSFMFSSGTNRCASDNTSLGPANGIAGRAHFRCCY